MTTEHELSADLDNLIAGLRIENINLKLAAKQAYSLLRTALHEMCNTSAPRNSFTDAVDAIDAFLASQQGERNQCDGCQAGIPAVDGAHRMGRPGGYPDLMSCQKERYEHPEQAEGAQGEREETPNPSCSMCRGSGYFCEFSTAETCWCCLPEPEPEETVEALKARIESLKAGITNMKQQRDAAIARAALAQPSPKCAVCNDSEMIFTDQIDHNGQHVEIDCPECAQPEASFGCAPRRRREDRLMSDVKRYAFQIHRRPYGLEEVCSGNLVMHSDYAKLEAEAQALREEVAALRAGVVVVPDAKQLLPDDHPDIGRFLMGWNACLDALARLNGKAVSEGLLRTLIGHATGEIKHLNNGLCPDDLEGHGTRDPDCAVCQALLGEGRES